MKKFLGIVVLGLLLSSNAYAIELNKCFLLERNGKDRDSKFDSDKWERNYYEFDFNNGIVTSYLISNDAHHKKSREDAERLAKQMNVSEVSYPEQISVDKYKMTHASERVVKAERVEQIMLGVFRWAISVDLEKGTVKHISEGKSVDQYSFKTLSEWSKQCKVSGSMGSGLFDYWWALILIIAVTFFIYTQSGNRLKKIRKNKS